MAYATGLRLLSAFFGLLCCTLILLPVAIWPWYYFRKKAKEKEKHIEKRQQAFEDMA